MLKLEKKLSSLVVYNHKCKQTNGSVRPTSRCSVYKICLRSWSPSYKLWLNTESSKLSKDAAM